MHMSHLEYGHLNLNFNVISIMFLLLQVEDRDSVSHRTDDSVTVFGEVQVSLAINGPEQVGKLK